MRMMVFIFIFMGCMAPGFAQEASATDEIVIKAAHAYVFAMTTNLKLTQDQISAVTPLVKDYIVKVRDLQQSVQDGTMDSKTMYDQKQQLTQDEDRQLGSILNPDQMRVFTTMQEDQQI